MKHFSIPSLFFGLSIFISFNAAHSAPLELYRFLGAATGDRLGSSIACLGPFGSGSVTSDFVLGIPGGGLGGQVTAYRGANGTTVLYDFISNASSGRLGRAVAPVGDINTDGRSDFAVGDPGLDQARIIFGPDGGTTLDLNNPFAGTGSDYGVSIAGLFSDANLNGTNDVIIGAPLHNSTPGVVGFVTIMDGNTGTSVFDLEGINDGDALGTAVDSISDYSNDGRREVLVSAPGASSAQGSVFVIVSSDGGVALRIDGTSGPNSGFGNAISSIGDIDGDSRDDILIGAPSSDVNGTDSGQAFLFSGASGNLICTFTGNPGDNLGYSVADVGDQALNGTKSFAIGAPGVNNNRGQVKIHTYSSSSGACSELFTLNGSTSGEKFGISLTNRHITGSLPSCDINGDGNSDFAVGNLDQSAGTDAGGAVFYGAFVMTPTPTVTPTPTIVVTATPTISSKPPKSATLWYKFQNDGTLSVKSELSKDPKGHDCTVSLFGRRSSFDRSKPGPIITLIKGAKAEKISRFRALKLRKVRAERAGRPYLFHMIAQYQCSGKGSFNTNVFARKLTCGLKPLVSVRDWEKDLSSKIE